jgi:endonuclease G, mitochondrial
MMDKPQRRGYDAYFLGLEIPFPEPKARIQEDMYKSHDSLHLHYMHFSVALSISRHLAHWAAWNIDGALLNQDVHRTGKSFRLDKLVPRKYQAGNKFYVKNDLDKGHLARHEDVVWGNNEEAMQASYDSFFYTNITPQAFDFNQSKQGGIWGQLENAALEVTKNQRMSCFAGPIFQDSDQVYRDDLRIPSKFFKILVYEEDKKITTKAFVLFQDLAKLTISPLDKFAIYEKGIFEIESSCFFTFPDILQNSQKLSKRLFLVDDNTPIESIDKIDW